MLKAQALKNPGDAWKNVTLDGRWFDIHGMTEEWSIPDKGPIPPIGDHAIPPLIPQTGAPQAS